MSDLTLIEKTKLEKLLQMGGGYVLDFSNRGFAAFVVESTGKDIYDSTYDCGSGSKANRLRAFWTEEANHLVGKLISDLLGHIRNSGFGAGDPALLEECRRIAERLRHGAPVQDIDAISPNSGGRDFEVLAKAVKDAIERNEPEAGLDRLHTFVVKYMRVLCEKHGITVAEDKPLHALVGEYVKRLKKDGRIESEMTERILKSTISTMEAFNRVRNRQSFAHDNPVLNYDESLLIFNHVASAIRFMGVVEDHTGEGEQEEPEANICDDLPF
ncbi:MAG TPA: abortive infection family protein [Phycisphaerae bacterium]|nr:abortive infection family protein [Phycisphaerae bacterium]